jgi:sortilin (neurotensin receptor 3)/immunoglobulin I-set domain protein
MMTPMRTTLLLPRNLFALLMLLCIAAPNGLISQTYDWDDVPASISERKPFKRFEWFYRQRAESNGVIPADVYYAERSNAISQQKLNSDRNMQRKMNMPSLPSTSLSWTSIGPGSVASGYPSHWGNVSGRVRAIAVSQSNASLAYLGAASGGIWKTTNGGSSWADVGVNLESMTFGAIAIDPSNSSNVYAGAGEARYLFNKVTYDGQGMFKSTDAGASWTQITNGFGSYTHFSDLLVSPHDSNVLLAALGSGYWHLGGPGNEGLWRSTDAGLTWTQVLNANDSYDLEFHPTNSSIVYAAVKGGIYRSTDAGVTWSSYGSGLPATDAIDRIHIALAQSANSTMYAAIYTYSSSTLASGTTAWKTTDGGANWSQISTGVSLGGNYGSGWVDQGSYDLCIAVSPSDANRVFIGNIELHLSSNGADFSPLRVAPASNAWNTPMHVDIHTIVFAPSNANVVYGGCDGGIFKSTNAGADWSSVNSTLPTLQLYRVASHPSSRDDAIGGAQDNGNFRKTSTGSGPWSYITTGDGMECFYDYSNPSTVYFSTQNGSLYKSTNGGINYSKVVSINGAWLTPFVMHPSNPSIIYSANKDFRRSTDGGVNWSVLSAGVTSDNIISIAVNPVTPANIMIAGSGDYNSSPPVSASTNGGTSWTDVSANIPGTKRFIPVIAADPSDANTFYVVRSGFISGNKIYKTTNLGATWTNISGNLPNVPHSAIFIDPNNTNHYYTGNDLGVYKTSDGGSTWIHESAGMPVVPVIDFSYSEIGTEYILRAATHGRSVYEAVIGAPCISPSVTANPVNTTLCSGILASFTATASGTSPITVQWEQSIDDISFTAISGATSTTLSLAAHDSINGRYYRAEFSNACGTATSASAQISVQNTPSISSHPSDLTVCDGSSASFGATDSGATSYQWQSSSDGISYSAIPGETASSLSFTASSSSNGYFYRLLASNACGTETSNPAQLTVSAAFSIATHPKDLSICDSGWVTFTARASGSPLPSIQWEQSADGSTWVAMLGANDTTLTFYATVANSGTLYRVLFTAPCGAMYTSTATLTVDEAPSIIQNPVNATACSGDTAYFSVAASGLVQQVKWQKSGDGISYADIPSADALNLRLSSISGADDGSLYRAIVSNICGIDTSQAATLNVSVPVNLTNLLSLTLCEGNLAIFSTIATGTYNAIQWEVSFDGINYTTVAGETDTALTFNCSIADNGARYRAVFSDDCGETRTNAATLTVNSNAEIIQDPQNATVCTGTSAVFRVQASSTPSPSIQWQESLDAINFIDIAGETSDSLVIFVTTAHNKRQYRAVATNICAASTSNPAELLVSSGFGVTASSDVSTCTGSAVQLDVQMNGGIGPFTYLWSPAANLSDEHIANPVANPATTTTYISTVTDANGCVAFDSVTVTVNSRPTARAGADAVVCEGSDVLLGDPATGGTPPYSYSWSPSSGLSADTSMSPLASPVLTTNYTLTVTDANGCSSSDEVLVTVHPASSVDAGESRLLCLGASTIIGDAASGGTPPFEYEWSPINGLNDFEVAAPIATPSATTIYTVVVTDAMGCVTRDSITITVNTSPMVDAGLDTAVCKGTPVSINAAATGGTAPYSYIWTPSTGLSAADIANPIATPHTTTAYTLTVVDANGCTGSDQIEVAIHNNPVALAGSDVIVCAGEEVLLGNYATGGTEPYSYIWTPSTGLSDPNVAKPLLTTTVTTTYSLTVTDAQGCVAEDEVVVTVLPQPVASAGADIALCEDGDAQMIGVASGGTPPYIYAWFPSAGLSDAHIARPIVKPAQSTVYTLTITDASGCTASDEVLVDVVTLTKPKIITSRPTELCDGELVTLSLVETFSSYRWSTGETTPSITVDKAGEYYVIVSNSLNCRDTSKPVIVTVSPMPSPVVYGPAAVCPDTQATYTVIPRDDISYEWSIAGGVILTDSYGASVRVHWNTIGSGALTVHAMNNVTGCSKDSTLFVQVSPTFQPVIEANKSMPICNGESVVLSAGTGYASYLWSTGETSHKIEARFPGEYTVKVTLPSGCSGTSDVYTVVLLPNPKPVVTASGPVVLCEGESVTLDAGPGFSAYKWTTGATTRAITVSVSGVYAVTVNNPSGCQNTSINTRVTVQKRPNIQIEGNYVACQGSIVGYLAPDTTGVTYLWNAIGGFVVTGQGTSSAQVVWNQAGYGWVTLEMAGQQGGCTVFEEQRVLVHSTNIPKVSVNGPTTVCEGTTVSLSTEPGYASYKWSTHDTTRIISVTKSGIYFVDVVDVNGCVKRSEIVTITVDPLPDATIVGPVRIQPVTKATFSVPAVPGYSYLWNSGHGTIVGGQGTANVEFLWDSEGPDVVTVVVANKNKCKNSYTHDVEITDAYFPEIIVLGPTTICEGDSVRLRGPVESSSYSWSNGEITPEIYVKEAGRYVVTVTDKFGFKWDSRPVNIYVIPEPRPVITLYGPPEICEGETLLLEAPDGYAGYSWSHGGGGRRAYITKAGFYTVTVRNIYGCTGTSEVVEVRSRPAPDKPIIVQNGNKLITSEGDWYQWYVNGLKIPDGTEKILVTDFEGIYTVRVGNKEGCSTISDPYDYTVILTDVTVPLILSGDAGDIIRIPIRLTTADDLGKAQSMDFKVTLEFYKNILTPLNASYYDEGDFRYTTLTGTIPHVFSKNYGSGHLRKAAEEISIAEFECMAMLGTRDSSIVRIVAIEFADYHIGAHTTDGVFRLNTCRNGGHRLFDDQGTISLEQNRPNPFNASTVIEYEIIERGTTQLYVMDMMGRRIKSLVNDFMEPGRYSISFSLGGVASGTYMYVLQTPTQIRHKLMEMVK